MRRLALRYLLTEKEKNVAKQIRYLNREARDFKRNHNRRSSAKKKSFFALDTSSSILTKLVGLALFGLIGYQIYQFAAAKLAPKQTNAPVELNDPATIQAKKSNSNKYRCDGRQYCSQMVSCEEAKWFLQNCSDTKMDGDGDGIPCEDKCGGW